MTDKLEKHLDMQFARARDIFDDTGIDGLIKFLESISYGSGDKFCAMDLKQIRKSSKFLKIKKDYMLWEKVKRFFIDWDMTAPRE